MKFRIKSEIFWFLTTSGIEIYHGCQSLRKYISCKDDKKLFDFLKFLSIPKTETEIKNYELLSVDEKEDIFKYLIDNHYGYWGVKETYSRNELFLNSFPQYDIDKFQKYQNDSKIVIIGLGTAGSYLLEVLTKLNFKNIIIIDYDVVEFRNIEAQNYSESDIGYNKIQALTQKYSSYKNIISHLAKVKNYEELKSIVPELLSTDFIINAADDHELMISLLKAWEKGILETPIIECGYGVLNQSVYLIDSSSDAAFFHHRLLEFKSEKKDFIINNNGSILNSIFSSFIVVNFIVNYCIGRKKNYAVFDFFENQLTIKNINYEKES